MRRHFLRATLVTLTATVFLLPMSAGSAPTTRLASAKTLAPGEVLLPAAAPFAAVMLPLPLAGTAIKQSTGLRSRLAAELRTAAAA